MTKKGATHHEQPLYSIQALGMSMLTSSYNNKTIILVVMYW